MMTHSPLPRRAGFTLVDVMIASVIFGLIVLTMGQTIAGLSAEQSALATSTRLQDMGARALDRIYGDLYPSGTVVSLGKDYPYLFEDGFAEAPFGAHAHAAAVKTADLGEADFGPNREIVLCRPADADGNNIPDVDGNGELVWDVDEVSYVVVTEGGVNYLQRRINGGRASIVASHVERIAFDDTTTSGFVVPLDAVRVRIWFRMNDELGLLHRYSVESTMKLRNG